MTEPRQATPEQASFVGQSLNYWAREMPGDVALSVDDQSVSWNELLQSVSMFAAYLQDLQCSRSAHFTDHQNNGIALALPNSIEFIVAFLSVVRLGKKALVYDADWPLIQRQQLQKITQPQFLIDADNWAEHWHKAQAFKNKEVASRPLPSTSFYVGFTSGSTGMPKGYRRCHQSWLDSFEISNKAFAFQTDDVVLTSGSLATSLHLYGAIHALHCGHSVVLGQQFRPQALLRQIRQTQASVLYMTPTQLQMLLLVAEQSDISSLDSVRRVLISGAKWSAEDGQRLRNLMPNAVWYEFYGTSEMSFISLRSSDSNAPKGSVGQVMPSVNIQIRDDENQISAAHKPGRIWVKSPLLFDGYECGDANELKAEGGWVTVCYHGYLDEQGYLFLLGREHRMLNCSGVNVYPEQVEQVIEQMDDVKQCMALGIADKLRGQRLVVVVSLTSDQRSDGTAHNIINRSLERDLKAYCRQHLPQSHQPWRWLRLEQWPTLSSGKVDQMELQRWAEKKMATPT